MSTFHWKPSSDTSDWKSFNYTPLSLAGSITIAPEEHSLSTCKDSLKTSRRPVRLLCKEFQLANLILFLSKRVFGSLYLTFSHCIIPMLINNWNIVITAFPLVYIRTSRVSRKRHGLKTFMKSFMALKTGGLPLRREDSPIQGSLRI